MPWVDRGKSKKAVSVEDGWGAGLPRLLRLAVYAMMGLFLLGAVLLAWWWLERRAGQETVPAGGSRWVAESLPAQENYGVSLSELEEKRGSAEAVARAFLDETEPERRLAWVRNPEEVRGHWEAYPEQALRGAIGAMKPLGMSVVEGRSVTAFAVAFEDGSFRLLEVVEEDAGFLVDWDGYARYCSVAFPEFVAGKRISSVRVSESPNREDEALVRVFVRPGDYYNVPFEDRSKWVGFRIESPDLDVGQYAFGLGQSPDIRRLQEYIMKSGNLRQHATLRLRRHESVAGQHLFEIVEVLAPCWILVESGEGL